MRAVQRRPVRLYGYLLPSAAPHDNSAVAVDKAMQTAITSTGHPIVLSIEGQPPVQTVSAGGHGQIKRVGHDIGDNHNRPWYSIGAKSCIFSVLELML